MDTPRVSPTTAHHAVGALVALYTEALGAVLAENAALRESLAKLSKELMTLKMQMVPPEQKDV
jgi:hypothetical protein